MDIEQDTPSGNMHASWGESPRLQVDSTPHCFLLLRKSLLSVGGLVEHNIIVRLRVPWGHGDEEESHVLSLTHNNGHGNKVSLCVKRMFLNLVWDIYTLFEG